MDLPDHQRKEAAVSPFLNVFKDGQLVDSFCLDSRSSFVLGRHTNCDMLLAHPSISRHHLKIQLLHETQEALLTDMDSVHGTWVDGKQIPSLIPYNIKAGVAFRLGASSRAYMLDWLHHAVPASSTARLRAIEADDSNISNTRTMVTANNGSVKPSDPGMERSSNFSQSRLLETNDTCENDCNKRDSFDGVRQRGCSSPAINQKTKNSEAVAPNGCSVDAVEDLTGSVVSQISQTPQQKPPLPPASRRIPFAPLPQNAATPAVDPKLKPFEKKLVSGEQKLDENRVDKIRKKQEENVLKGSRLQRCHSAPSPVLQTTASVYQQFDTQDKCSITLLKRFQEKKRESVVIKNTQKIDDVNVKSRQVLRTDQKSLKENTEPTVDSTREYAVMKNTAKIDDEKSKSSQVLHTDQKTLKEKPESTVEGIDCSPSKIATGRPDRHFIDQLVACSLIEGDALDDGNYPSDKENNDPLFDAGKRPTEVEKHRNENVNREPFQPLIVMPRDCSRSSSPCQGYRSEQEDESFFWTRSRSRTTAVVENLDHMLQKLRGMVHAEPHYIWHMVVDSTCLLDLRSFKSLKLLQGIKDIRIIIPQIVIRELEFSSWKNKKNTCSTAALKWIERCMLESPSWIHVQNTSENLPVGVSTPPASPPYGWPSCASALGDLASRIKSDHVLNCALVFNTAEFHGRVALLTNDTALKIKAMAEGIVCDGAVRFCESLLNPYSDRFLWAGSVAHHGPGSQRGYNGMFEYSDRITEKPNRRHSFMSVANSMICGKNHHAVENLKNYCKQAQGLRVILS